MHRTKRDSTSCCTARMRELPYIFSSRGERNTGKRGRINLVKSRKGIAPKQWRNMRARVTTTFRRVYGYAAATKLRQVRSKSLPLCVRTSFAPGFHNLQLRAKVLLFNTVTSDRSSIKGEIGTFDSAQSKLLAFAASILVTWKMSVSQSETIIEKF